MRADQIKKSAEEMGVSVDSAIRMRVRYLQSLLGLWVSYIDEQIHEIPESDVMAIIGEMAALKRYQDNMKSGIVLKGITDEMIGQARNYPIDSLIEFHYGKATAFCHDDKRPSLSWHKAKNRATCFPCGKSFSALDVCIERDGMDFISAVKMLAGGM